MRKQNSAPSSLLEIQSSPPQGHAALTSAFDPILVVMMPGDAETFKSDIDEMTYGTDFKLINSLHRENTNLTHQNHNTSIDKLGNR
jgi:hypothetical protein